MLHSGITGFLKTVEKGTTKPMVAGNNWEYKDLSKLLFSRHCREETVKKEQLWKQRQKKTEMGKEMDAK